MLSLTKRVVKPLLVLLPKPHIATRLQIVVSIIGAMNTNALLLLLCATSTQTYATELGADRATEELQAFEALDARRSAFGYESDVDRTVLQLELQEQNAKRTTLSMRGTLRKVVPISKTWT